MFVCLFVIVVVVVVVVGWWCGQPLLGLVGYL